MITQEEFNVTKQNNRELYYKINLLNDKFQIIDELSGVAVSLSFTNNASSNIRRTGSLTITPNDPNAFKMKAGSKIWLDKYVQIYVGIKDIITDKIIYTNMGIYLVNDPSQTLSSTDDSITISLIDLMSKMTGDRGGALDGYSIDTYHIDAGSDIKEQMSVILEKCGFYNYIINIADEDYHETQIDINIDNTQSYYNVLVELDYVNTNYQMYFDLNGVFHYEKIPSGHNEQVMVNDEIWKECLISASVSNSYSDIKNHIVVLGKTHDISHFCANPTISTGTITAKDSSSVTVNQYVCQIPSVSMYLDNLKIGMTPSSIIANKSFINVNNLGTYPILTRKHEWCDEVSVANTYYVLKLTEVPVAKRFDLTIGNKVYSPDYYWEFLGEVSPKGYAIEDNPESPYYINGSMGDIAITLSGGEYDNITTSELATQRAEWELYTRCRLQDNIKISCVPIFWLDVNWVVEVTLPNETIPSKYIIKDISTDCSISGVQEITAMKYYSFYE